MLWLLLFSKSRASDRRADVETLSESVQYFLDRSMRRGAATWGDFGRAGQECDDYTVDVLARTLHDAGVALVGDQDVGITPQTNVLMNDLTLTELVSLCLQLPVAPKTPRQVHKYALSQRSYELDLKRLDYLDSDSEWYYLSPAFNHLQRSIRQLFRSGEIPFATQWEKGDLKTNPQYLKVLMAHPAFAARALPEIREHYLGLWEVGLLVGWIKAAGQTPVMCEIMRAGLEHDGSRMVRAVLLSDQASTARSVLEERRDVCFSCPPQQRCWHDGGATDPYELLMGYRSTTLDSLLASRHPGKTLKDCLLEDWLIAKFFLP